jgi:hypothetical protein
MANVNAPFGLRPVGTVNGQPYTGAARTYSVPAGDGTAIYIGDAVKLVGTSQIINGSPYSDIAIAATGDVMVGVVIGVLPATRDSLTYRAASTQRLVLVADDPGPPVRDSAGQQGGPAHGQRCRPQRQPLGGRRLDRHRLLRNGRRQRDRSDDQHARSQARRHHRSRRQRHRLRCPRARSRATSWFASTGTNTPTKSRESNRWPLSTPATRRSSFGPA